MAGRVPIRDTDMDAPTLKLSRLVDSEIFRLKINELRLFQQWKDRSQNVMVSVIMATWNRAFIIQRAIDSVLRQSYKNFELIISDDGSTDGTTELIEKTYGRDGRVRYVRSEHAGVSRARNTGLGHSRGSLIAYLDTDNVWADNFLLLMTNSFVDNPTVHAAYCGIKVIDNIEGNDYIRLARYDRRSLLTENYIDLNIFMHRRSLFEELGGFNEGLTALVDWELVLRYTQEHIPHVLECILASYYLDKDFGHIRYTENLHENYRIIRNLYS